MNEQEKAFVQRVQSNAHRLAEDIDASIALMEVYFDRGYNGGGANVLDDAALAERYITATQLASYVTLAQQLQALRNGEAVAPADYGATLNQVRAL